MCFSELMQVKATFSCWKFHWQPVPNNNPAKYQKHDIKMWKAPLMKH